MCVCGPVRRPLGAGRPATGVYGAERKQGRRLQSWPGPRGHRAHEGIRLSQSKVEPAGGGGREQVPNPAELGLPPVAGVAWGTGSRAPQSPVSRAPLAPGLGTTASQLGRPLEESQGTDRGGWISAQAPVLPLQSVEGKAKPWGRAHRQVVGLAAGPHRDAPWSRPLPAGAQAQSRRVLLSCVCARACQTS